AFAQREIVFARAALVAMALDPNRDVGVTLQPRGLPLQRLLSLGIDIRPVEGEENAVAGGRGEILLRARGERRGADPGRWAGRTGRTAGRRRWWSSCTAGEHAQHTHPDDHFRPHPQPLETCRHDGSTISAAAATRPDRRLARE